MKKFILFALLLYAGVLAARLVHDVIADAQGGPATANGDVNGDRSRDISDAIYLLNWLFGSGPEPVALAGSPDLESRVAGLEEAVAALAGSPAGVPAAVESLALLLGDPAIAEGVPPGTLQPLAGASPFALVLDGEPFGEVVGVHIVEEVSSLPLAHLAVRISTSTFDTDSLLGSAARLDFQPDGMTHFAGEVVAAGFAGRQGRGAVLRLSIAPRLHRLMRTRRSRTFVQQKYSDILSRVLGEHGIAPLVEASQLQRQTVIQYNETDFDFVSRLMEEEGMHFFFEHSPQGATLRASSRSTAAPEAPGVFPYRGHLGGPLVPGEAYVRTFHSALLPAPGTVQVSGWDYVNKERLTRAHATGTEGGLYDLFLGQRDLLEEVGGEARFRGERFVVEARAVLGTSTIPRARPGQVVTIGGIGGAFDGKYFVTAVRHTMVMAGAGGEAAFHYGNAFQCIPASLPFRPERRAPRPAIAGVLSAIITNNQDPDALGRVKVKFPWLGDGVGEAESGWMRLSQPGAGEERGAFWLPEVDDEVLVAFDHGDVQQPVVLGGVWNREDPPPEEPTPRNDRRLFKSRAGHLLVFDDTDGSENISIRSKKKGGQPGSIALEASSTQVSGVLASSDDAGPLAAVQPGERHRDNSIIAWARVSAAGEVVAPGSFGVASARRVRAGAYQIFLSGAARSAAEVIPIAVAQVSIQPLTAADLRIASVDQVDARSFAVYFNNGQAVPADAEFVFMVTAR